MSWFLVFSEADGTVDVGHATARAFLSNIPDGMDSTPHKTIGLACLTYMSMSEMAKGPADSLAILSRRLENYPFLSYSTRFYGYHILATEMQFKAELSRFLEHDMIRQAAWQILHFNVDVDHKLAQSAFNSSPSRPSALHVASYWGFLKYLNGAIGSNKAIGVSSAYNSAINVCDSRGWSPLHWAASMGKLDVVKSLLNAGASVNSTDLSGWSSIFLAAIRGYEDMVAELLNNGAISTISDHGGLTPLYLAICAGQDSTALLLWGHENEAGLPYSDTKLRSLKQLKDLSISGAKAMVTPSDIYNSWLYDLNPNSPNHITFRTASKTLEQNLSLAWEDSHGKRSASSRPLIRNVLNFSLKACHIQFDGKSHQEPKSTISNFLARMTGICLSNGHLRVFKLLLDLNFSEAYMIDEKEYLHYVISALGGCDNPGPILELVRRGASVNLRNNHGQTPLHVPCVFALKNVVNVLLGVHGIDVDAKDSRQRTPLMTIRFYRMSSTQESDDIREICKLLISKGASTCHRDADDNTLLHLSIRKWDPTLIKTFLDANPGPKINARNKYGQTPMHCLANATPFWYPMDDILATIDMVLELSEPGNINLTCTSDLENAMRHGNWTLAARLCQKGAILRRLGV
ncbi:hypothetical protein AJ80_02293 [Polytolypa hystricis UAMH7299]|uniref:Uncharacterized protein n=1 Tax=Polytolypa hystricis (strain UAMH7299) TaxID=1447883 RepID=A0A2B7YST9_POLH7|nr:hypothetical protein AJ80_02293 [Polytolypa hystricis UAMH7299]